jgi:hypothetical protein
MPKTSKDGRRKLCEVLAMGEAGSETWDAGTAVAAKLRLRSGCVSQRGLGMSSGAGAGNGKGGTSNGSRRAGPSFACGEVNASGGIGLGQDAATSKDEPMSRCWWSTRAVMLLSIMAATVSLAGTRRGCYIIKTRPVTLLP